MELTKEFLFIYKALKSTFQDDNSASFERRWALLEEGCLPRATTGARSQSENTDKSTAALVECSSDIKEIFGELEERERELELVSVEDLLLSGKIHPSSTSPQNETDKCKYFLSFLRIRCQHRMKHWQVLEDKKSQLQSRLEQLSDVPTSRSRSGGSSREVDCIRDIIKEMAEQLAGMDLTWETEAEPENQESKDQTSRLKTLRELALKWWDEENKAEESASEPKTFLSEQPLGDRIQDNLCLQCVLQNELTKQS